MEREEKIYGAIAILCIFGIVFLYIWAFCGVARAEEINVEALATAIGKAENSKAHPYGIMAHYEHTTPRQACVNTIRHGLKDWNGKGDFITFLGDRYCPPAAHPLNKNWVKNVSFFYAQLTGRGK